MTVGLEMGGAEHVRPYIEAAHAEHPSLVDEAHRMDALFGVTNIPQVVWIDEDGVIVRPPEQGSPAPPPTDDPFAQYVHQLMTRRRPSPEWYGDRIRDWVRNGVASEWAMTPEQVVAASQPRSPDESEAAAHFALAQHLWRAEGFTPAVFEHFGRAHTLQPDNITYKRQAYSQFSYGQQPDERARFNQSPKEDEREAWPFVSDFDADMVALRGPNWLDEI